MDCKNQQQAFNDAMTNVQNTLKEELTQIALRMEQKTKELNDDFKNGNDLAKGVGATAGTIIGGLVGGEPGAVAGGTLGQQIGSFFTIEIGNKEYKISFDLPSIELTNQEWIFNVPSVTMKDTDIIFNLPTLVMKTVEGPQIPKTRCEMKTVCNWTPFGDVCYDVPQCTIYFEPSYYDVPSWEDRETRIVLGVPQVTNIEQKVVVGVPEIVMRPEEIIFNLPDIKITFIKDAGKELAEALSKIALSASEDSAEKQLKMKERMKFEVVEPAIKMFDCFRGQIIEQKDKTSENYDSEIKKLTDALFNLKSNNVPETDNDYISQKTELDSQILNRNLTILKFDEALKKFDEEKQKALNSFIGS